MAESANRIIDGVDLDVVAHIIGVSACFGVGQAYSTLSRVLVPDALATQLGEGMVAVVSKQQLGDPLDPTPWSSH
ncbi:aldehyde dehydrogenase family protein [Mycolicibacterium holsaticum]|uniref:Aldehyde dehydrogenase domain-containing protein n=1 Tax=Mycolicibacterium holsaticum TaxID=152142 RepID=A0A1E3RU06_9MYCO|nr:aldehyde dehydrogenase family protein [Mycolicibacterium holsaticum]ODQ93395.1 hypothetical protein BHQ17_13600 [Mycolicibacterium holsaticum]